MQLLMASVDVLLHFGLKSMCFIVTGEGKLNFKAFTCCSRRPPVECPASLQPRYGRGRDWGGPAASRILSFALFPFCRFKDLLMCFQGVSFPRAFSALPGCLWHYPCRQEKAGIFAPPSLHPSLRPPVPPSFPAPCLPRRGGCRGCMCCRRAAPTVRLCRSGGTPQSTGCMHKQSIYTYTRHLQRHTRTVMHPYIYVDVCICIQILYICMHMHTYTCVYTHRHMCICKLYAYARICTRTNMSIRICVSIPTYPRARAAHNAPMYALYVRMYRHTGLPLFTNANT